MYTRALQRKTFVSQTLQREIGALEGHTWWCSGRIRSTFSFFFPNLISSILIKHCKSCSDYGRPSWPISVKWSVLKVWVEPRSCLCNDSLVYSSLPLSLAQFIIEKLSRNSGGVHRCPVQASTLYCKMQVMPSLLRNSTFEILYSHWWSVEWAKDTFVGISTNVVLCL